MMLMINKLYYLFRKLITAKEEQNQYSGGYWPRRIREKFLEYFSDSVNQNKNVRFLEVGCGEGLFLNKLATKFPMWSIQGVDSWGDVLQQARNRLINFSNVTLSLAEGHNLPFEPDYFDYVAFINVILNIADIKNVENIITQIVRVTKPGGEIVFDIRNGNNFWLPLQYKLVKIYDPHIKVPVRTYKDNQIMEIIKNNNLELKQKIYFGFPDNKFSPIILYVTKKNNEKNSSCSRSSHKFC